MSSKDIAICVENLSKSYQLYPAPADRLKQFIIPRIKRFTGGPEKSYYRDFWALRHLSFEISKGETVGIVGRNGSGKSTLLQIIAGTISPTEGHVSTNGRTAALLELGSGFNPEFTGRENVFLNGAVLGLSRNEIESKFDDIAAFAEIGEFLHQPLRTYSSGMVLRLAFSVAINVAPDILIVDEALAVGDEAFQRKCFARLNTFRESGGTILFVSHAGGLIVELCNRAILLDKGEQLLMSNPKDVVNQYHKLIFAPSGRVVTLREEIRAKKAEVPRDDQEVREVATPPEEEEIERHALFDPGLLPKSTTRYENRGASIEDAEIRTPGGRRVNFLCRGDEYVYSYTVRFQKEVRNVLFGMLIKTVTGFELGGALSSPHQTAIPQIQKGSIVHVAFRFQCLLTPGMYFMNAGVQGNVDGEDSYLDRIIDALAFRVQPEAAMLNTAIVDFRVIPSVTVQTSGSPTF
jgi:lipopolysaccharide transport system ATP-binding protein